MQRQGVDILGILAFASVLAIAGVGIYFIVSLPKEVLIVLAGAIGLAIASLPAIVVAYLIRDRGGRGRNSAREDRPESWQVRQAREMVELQRLAVMQCQLDAQLAELNRRNHEERLAQPQAGLPTAQPERQYQVLGGDGNWHDVDASTA